MQANQMYDLFKDLYDGASAEEMGFDSSEVSRFLTLSQSLEIENRLFANRNPYREGYEVGMKRDTEFSELKRHVYIWNDTVNSRSVIVNERDSVVYEEEWREGIFPHSFIITLPRDFMYHSVDLIDIEWKNKRYDAVTIKSTNEDGLAELRLNSFIKPDKRVVYRYTYPRYDYTTGDKYVNPEEESVLEPTRKCLLLTDENTVLKRYYLSYLRQPKAIVVDIINPTNQVHCELNSEFHIGIVKRAVGLAMGSIGSEKYQVAMNEKHLNE